VTLAESGAINPGALRCRITNGPAASKEARAQAAGNSRAPFAPQRALHPRDGTRGPQSSSWRRWRRPAGRATAQGARRGSQEDDGSWSVEEDRRPGIGCSSGQSCTELEEVKRRANAPEVYRGNTGDRTTLDTKVVLMP